MDDLPTRPFIAYMLLPMSVSFCVAGSCLGLIGQPSEGVIAIGLLVIALILGVISVYMRRS